MEGKDNLWDCLSIISNSQYAQNNLTAKMPGCENEPKSNELAVFPEKHLQIDNRL